MQPALLGGLFIGVLSALPLVSICNCCCLWIVSGGVLAAYLQQQQRPAALTPLEGARTGLIAGAIGALVWLVVAQAFDVVLGPIREQVMGEVLRNSRDMPPEVRSMVESMSANQTGAYAFQFFVMLVFGSLIAAAGGAIGAAYFRNDVPPALGGPIPPPPLP